MDKCPVKGNRYGLSTDLIPKNQKIDFAVTTNLKLHACAIAL
jgi:hypothetical protein